MKDSTLAGSREGDLFLWMPKRYGKTTLESLKEKVSKPSFETWLKSTYPQSYENNILTIEVPNDSHVNGSPITTRPLFWILYNY